MQKTILDMNMPTLTQQNQVAMVAGDLIFDSVLLVRQPGIRMIQQGVSEFNFDQVGKTDSAAVALLLEWWRTAKAANQQLRFKNLPKSMLAMIKVASLGAVLAESFQ